MIGGLWYGHDMCVCRGSRAAIYSVAAQVPIMACRRRTVSPPPPAHVRAESGAALLEELQRLFCIGELSAKSFCEIAHHSSKAGAVGSVKGWGLAPQPQTNTGHYSRHIDKQIRATTGVSLVQPVVLDVPCQARQTRARAIMRVAARPFHELIKNEVSMPLVASHMRRQMASRHWPPVVKEHSLVTSAGPTDLVIPLGIYVDSAQYGGSAGAGRTKSILVISVINMITNRRHVGIVFRKQLSCRCGCRGNCSFVRLFTFLRWSLDALAAGCYPHITWDSARWPDSESHRRGLGGTSLGFKGAVCYIMSDWEGLCQFFNVPNWKSAVHGCPLCDATRENHHMYRTALFVMGE